MQVRSGCEERGLVMEAVWEGHAAFVDGILHRIREQCSDFRSRQEQADSETLKEGKGWISRKNRIQQSY